jgi:hypothetical protein
MRRTLTGLVSCDDAAAAALRKINVGDEVNVTIQTDRKHKSLRRWWVLCNMVHENSDQFPSPEMVHDFLKIRAGHCTPIVAKSTGEVFLIADSIAFGRLDEDRFREVWRRAIKVVCEDIIPGLDSEAVELEILKVCGLAL